MRIISIIDKRLIPIVENPALTSSKGLEPARVRRLGFMVRALLAMTSPLQLKTYSGWRAHNYTPDQPRLWSLDLSGNWRLLFLVDQDKQEVSDLDIKDPHS